MLNENKIKMMTKMAIYEKNEGRQMIKNSRYFKGDYVAFGVLRTLIATTFAYIIMVILYVLCNLEKLVADINSLDYAAVGKRLGIYYILMLIVYTIIAAMVYAYQYNHSRKGLKKYFKTEQAGTFLRQPEKEKIVLEDSHGFFTGIKGRI